MQSVIIFNAILAVTFAAPGYFEYNNHGKSIFSAISQLISHESSHDFHPPILATHEVEDHVPLDKTTITKSNQVVNNGSTAIVHAPVVSAQVIHSPVVSAPLVHTTVVSAPVVHAAVYSSYPSPIVSYKTPNSAISHQRSTVHETVPVVNSFPLYASYH
ncbi:unnamed protein product [Euphydryas editha]|uniref:Cuticle protein n=1 Tax=Euphydryas editha TaxID=104508 RepID=A0AAU9TK83_EUPED|nr:unnamed protein product [Euphydryas editha]